MSLKCHAPISLDESKLMESQIRDIERDHTETIIPRACINEGHLTDYLKYHLDLNNNPFFHNTENLYMCMYNLGPYLTYKGWRDALKENLLLVKHRYEEEIKLPKALRHKRSLFKHTIMPLILDITQKRINVYITPPHPKMYFGLGLNSLERRIKAHNNAVAAYACGKEGPFGHSAHQTPCGRANMLYRLLHEYSIADSG